MLSPSKTRVGETVRRRLATLTGALLIGLIALGFAAAADRVQGLWGDLYVRVPVVALATPIIFAACAFLTVRYAPAARGSGIPQVIAVSTQAKPETSKLISPLTVAWKIALTLLALGAGAPVGREGPTVQVSAAIMTAVHRLFRVRLSAAVVIAGGAAGVSAAFNTPLAGIVFAFEELAAAYEQRLAVLSMAAVVIAGIVTLGLAGNYVYFGAVSDWLDLRTTLLVVPVIGVLGGIAGGTFSRLVLLIATSSSPFVRRIRTRPVVSAALCGTVVAILGVTSSGLSWGTGYGPAKILIEGGIEPWWLAPVRFAATLATAISGIPGGIFAPSLSIGAAFGGLLSNMFPGAPLGAVALIGMTAYFVGVVRAPLTSVVIVVEMTGSRTMLIPLLATALIADGIAALISPQRLYHGLAKTFSARPADTASPGLTAREEAEHSG